MVNYAGNLEIVGTIDVAGIKAGLSQVKRGLFDVAENAKATLGDMDGLGKSLSGIGSMLTKIGIGAAGALVGLAAMGPAVAPAMARIKHLFFEISKTLGESLAPAFDAFANLMQGFVGWLNSPEGNEVLTNLNSIFLTLIDSLKLLGGGLKGTYDWLAKLGKNFEATFEIKLGDVAKSLWDNFGWAGIGAIAGIPFGPAGMVAGAGAGLVAQNVINWETSGDSALSGNPIGGAVLAIYEGLKSFATGDWNTAIAGMASAFMVNPLTEKFSPDLREKIYERYSGVYPEHWRDTNSGLSSYTSEEDFFRESYDHNNFATKWIGGK